MIGGYGQIPFQVGQGLPILQIEHEALLDAYAPGWSKQEDTAHYAETFAHARIITTIWMINERIKNQAIPMRMLEALPEWEKILKLRPKLSDDEITRRSRVAAKLRGIVGNTLGDLSDVARAIFGSKFVQLVTPSLINIVTYWPGVNPGPPGFEWMSTRALVGIQLTTGLSQEDFLSKRQELQTQYRDMKPAWLYIEIGIGSEFIADLGIVDVTFI
jgi:hypothetical protein